MSILGEVDGFAIFYNTTTSITVTAGSIQANGETYTLAADATHNLTSLASAFDFHYIYIDDSASTPPTAVIIDSITEPAFDVAREGWYLGDDRLIGVLESNTGAATIAYFSPVTVADNYIESTIGRKSTIATAQTPDGTWQTPNTSQTSLLTPVNATSIQIEHSTGLGGGAGEAFATNAEMAIVNTAITDGTYSVKIDEGFRVTTPFMALGFSRNIRIAAVSGNNDMQVFIRGYGYSR